MATTTPLLLLALLSFVSSWTIHTPAVAPKVSGHAICNFGAKQDKLLLFGGLKEDRTATNDLWVYDDASWKTIQAQNEGPGPRMYVQAAELDGTIFVVGGWDPEEKGSGGSFKDEVWSLTATGTATDNDLEWKRCDPLPCGPLSRHTAVTVGDQIIVHTFQPQSIVVIKPDGTSHLQATTGDNAPVGLSMCCAAALNDHQMIVFGGSTKTQQMSKRVYLLDTTTWKWTKLTSTGHDIPTPRASPCMARIDDTSVLVFGGAGLSPKGYEAGAGLIGSDETFVLRTKMDDMVAEWTRMSDFDQVPRARVAASLSLIPGSATSSQQQYLLTGGWDPATAETFHDACVLDL